MSISIGSTTESSDIGTTTSGELNGLPRKKDTKEKIHDAASQFEALMIGQILKSAQPEGGWGAGEEQDPAASSAMDFANDYLARALSTKGGMGLAQMITKNLERASANHSSPATPDPHPADKLPSDR